MRHPGLLSSGALAAGAYITADVALALSDPGYSYVNLTISELAAIGAPTRAAAVPAFFVHGLLQFVFGLAMWQATTTGTRWRRVAMMMIGIGVVDLFSPWYPMHQRGMPGSLTDTAHIVATIVTSILILIAMVNGAAAGRGGFRVYTIASMVLVFGFGTWAGSLGPRIAAGLPTPWMGLIERTCIYSYMIWMLVVSARVYAAARRDASPKLLAADI